MSRSQYINTFSTTADYEAYIESATPKFPNIAYDEEAEKIYIRRESPNDYIIYGTLKNDYDYINAPTFNIKLNYKDVTAHTDQQTNTFYVTAQDLTSAGVTGTITSMEGAFQYSTSKITTIKKINLDTSSVTTIAGLFRNQSQLTSININGVDFSNVTSLPATIFYQVSSLTDIYINVEATLMKLTNNLSSEGWGNYIPSSATIHYNDVDYIWQNNAWTPQS